MSLEGSQHLWAMPASGLLTHMELHGGKTRPILSFQWFCLKIEFIALPWKIVKHKTSYPAGEWDTFQWKYQKLRMGRCPVGQGAQTLSGMGNQTLPGHGQPNPACESRKAGREFNLHVGLCSAAMKKINIWSKKSQSHHCSVPQGKNKESGRKPSP